MSKKLSFLGGDKPAEVEVVSATPVPPEAPRQPGPAPQPQPGETAPISALLDERDKRKAAQAQAEDLQRQIDDWRAKAQNLGPLPPEEAVRQALYNQNLRASRRFAEREYGKDHIAAVHDWATRRCDQDPFFNQQMRASEDPYEAAYQAFHREQILRNVKPQDLAAFKAWQAARSQAGPSGAQAAQTPARARAPLVPRSLATASGNGAAGGSRQAVGPGQAFASVINR